MYSAFTPEGYTNLVDRIRRLTPESRRHWGTMDVGQMLDHMNGYMEIAAGERKLGLAVPGVFRPLLRLIYLKWGFKFSKNLPTAPDLKTKASAGADVERHRERSLELLDRLRQYAEANAPQPPVNPLFGKGWKVWGEALWVHFDHHLRQFGV
jgi:hypothetical protein